jgi:ribosomal protein L7/L12
MLEATAGLAAGCVILLLISLAALSNLQKRTAALSRVEAKLDLLLGNAGLEYDPLGDVSAGGASAGGASTEIVEALRRGDKIGAIKHYRNASGAGLKDAKDYVEELQRRAGL